MDIAVFGLNQAYYSPYERPYLDGECDYHTVMHKETEVVHYVPKSPEVLEAFCDEVQQKAMNRKLNNEAFTTKVETIRTKGCITELDIRDLFLYFSVKLSLDDDYAKVWKLFSSEFLLNYQFILTHGLWQMDFQEFWNPIVSKIQKLFTREILTRVDLIKSEAEHLNGMIADIQQRKIMASDKNFVGGIQFFDDILNTACAVD